MDLIIMWSLVRMKLSDVYDFINSFQQPVCLATKSGDIVYANIVYGESFHGGRDITKVNFIDDIIRYTSEALVKANALTCQYYTESLFKHKKNTIAKELFFYKGYITYRSILTIDNIDYMLLIILEDNAFSENGLEKYALV